MQPKSPAGFTCLLIATFSLALVHLPSCTAHGFLLSPLSRGKALGNDNWKVAGGNGLGHPVRRYPDGRLLGDQADVCGDPHQDVGDMGLSNRVTPIQATYSKGQVIDVSTNITVNHGGWIGVSICNKARSGSGLSQACFDSLKLVNTETGTARWWIQSGEYMPPRGRVYQTKWRLPDNVACEEGCVLQMTYKTANSCVDSCSRAECGSVYAARSNPIVGVPKGPYDLCAKYPGAFAEVFRDCADIKITTSGRTPDCTDNNGQPILNQYGQRCDTCCKTWKAAGMCDGKSTVQGGKVVSTLCCKTCSS